MDFKNTAYYLKTYFLRPRQRRIIHKNEIDQFSDNLSDLNFTRRKALIFHAAEHSPFYSRVYKKNGINPSSILKEDDFCKIPIITRDDIKTHFQEIVVNNVKPSNYYVSTTGGSTGSPISVLHDRRYPLLGVQNRVLKWWGVQPFQNAAYIYRSRYKGYKKVINDLIWWPTRRITLDASSMESSNMHAFAELYNKIRPKILQGYVGAVYEFALFVLDNRINLVSPSAVWVTSAPLTQQQRLIMEEAFRAPVYDQYGTCEIMWLAAECKERHGLHMMSDLRHIEFVDEKNLPVAPNEWGRILLTDLVNYAFPLIRYEIGDYGRALNYNCKCGVKLPLMDNVKGRQSDLIKTPSGLIISGEYLTTIFDQFPGAIRQFQVVQGNDYSIQLRYVPEKGQNVDKIIREVLNGLANKTKNEIEITSEAVTEIPHIKGKTRFIISELSKVKG